MSIRSPSHGYGPHPLRGVRDSRFTFQSIMTAFRRPDHTQPALASHDLRTVLSVQSIHSSLGQWPVRAPPSALLANNRKKSARSHGQKASIPQTMPLYASHFPIHVVGEREARQSLVFRVFQAVQPSTQLPAGHPQRIWQFEVSSHCVRAMKCI